MLQLKDTRHTSPFLCQARKSKGIADIRLVTSDYLRSRVLHWKFHIHHGSTAKESFDQR